MPDLPEWGAGQGWLVELDAGLFIGTGGLLSIGTG